MIRLIVSLGILATGFVWVALGAPVWGGPGLLEPELDLEHPETICDMANPECIDIVNAAIRATAPTPVPIDPRIENSSLKMTS